MNLRRLERQIESARLEAFDLSTKSAAARLEMYDRMKRVGEILDGFEREGVDIVPEPLSYLKTSLAQLRACVYRTRPDPRLRTVETIDLGCAWEIFQSPATPTTDSSEKVRAAARLGLLPSPASP